MSLIAENSPFHSSRDSSMDELAKRGWINRHGAAIAVAFAKIHVRAKRNNVKAKTVPVRRFRGRRGIRRVRAASARNEQRANDGRARSPRSAADLRGSPLASRDRLRW